MRDACRHSTEVQPLRLSNDMGQFLRYHERHMPFVQARRRRRRQSPLSFVCEPTSSSQRNHVLRGTIVTASVEKTLRRDDCRGTVADVERAEDPEQMNLDRAFGDTKLACDRLVRLPACEESHDF